MDVLLSFAFLAGVLVMYWSMPVGCMLYRIRFLSFRGKRDDMFQWAKLVVDLLGVTLHQVGTNEVFRTSNPVLYIANHRCWADFFLDVYVTEGRAAMLSRWAVYPVFPVFLTAALILKGVIFFKRNRVVDKNVFNAFLDNCFRISPLPGLMVYPEGHRSTLPASLPLRRGMLAYAYSRQLPVQVVITKDKEKVLSEKKFTAGYGAHLMVGYSEVIHSKDFKDFEQFMARVQSVWDATWKVVYAADASCPILAPKGTATTNYPLQMKVLMAVYSLVATLLLIVGGAMLARYILLSQYGVPLSLGFVSLLVAAIQRATLPPPALPAA